MQLAVMHAELGGTMAFTKDKGTSGSKIYEVLSPLHEIDSFNGEELKTYIKNVLENTDVVILDLSRTAYLNSSGLRELIQIYKMMKDKNKELYLTQISNDIRKIFVHTNLDRIFIFFDTVSDAIERID